MRPIRAQLRTGSKQVAWTNWITAVEISRPEMDRGRRWLTTDGLVRRYIAAWYRWRPDRDGWPWWMTGDGWQWTSFPFMKILRLCEVIPLSRSLTLISSYKVTIERRYGDIRCTGGMAPPSTIPSTIQRYWIMHLHARVLMPNMIPNGISTQPRWCRVTKLQCRFRTSWSRTRFVFGGAMILKEGDDSAGIATTPTTNNYRTGSAGTKHETHSPMEKASSVKCMWRRSNNCTPRIAKSAPRVVMTNAPTDQSRSRMRRSQSRMRSQLSLGDPNSVSTIPRYTGATGKEEAVMD